MVEKYRANIIKSFNKINYSSINVAIVAFHYKKVALKFHEKERIESGRVAPIPAPKRLMLK